MGSPESFVRGGPYLTKFFFVFFSVDGGGGGGGGIEDPNTSINGPPWALPAKRHFNGISLAGRCWPYIECWLGSFVIFQGILTSIAKAINFCDFSGGGPDPLSSLLDPPMCTIKITSTNTADSDEIPHDLESQQGLP